MGIFNVLFIIVILIAFGVVGMAMNRKRLEKMEASNKVFLEKYPHAARVYPYFRAAIISEAVRVHTVDGEPPELFYETGKSGGIASLVSSVIAVVTGNGANSGFYLKPGTSTVEMSYYHNRPGFFYKNVTSTTDTVKMELTVEADKKYNLGFDRNNKNFILKEAG
jgi:hypothetical protein